MGKNVSATEPPGRAQEKRPRAPMAAPASATNRSAKTRANASGMAITTSGSLGLLMLHSPMHTKGLWFPLYLLPSWLIAVTHWRAGALDQGTHGCSSSIPLDRTPLGCTSHRLA